MATRINLDQVKDLDAFLTETEKLFKEMIYEWAPILFPKEYRETLISAWREITKKKGQQSYDGRLDISLLELLKEEITRSANQAELEKAGLGKDSSQLELKLNALRNAWEKFDRFGTIRLLKIVLKWINNILGSIASALPMAHALKEMKEAMETIIDAGTSDNPH